MFVVSAGFDAADGDDLGECHVTPTGYAHMTHMLCSLAGGKVVAALEVAVYIVSWSTCRLTSGQTGRLLSRCYCQLGIGSYAGPVGGHASPAGAYDRFGGRYRDHLPGSHGTEQVLEERRSEGL